MLDQRQGKLLLQTLTILFAIPVYSFRPNLGLTTEAGKEFGLSAVYLFRIENGRVIRLNDEPPHNEQPMRTKIVATIGSPTSYGDGFYDLDGKLITNPSYDLLVSQFYLSGVDVIRLNLAHVSTPDIRNVFGQIKVALRRCETRNGNKKRLAILADLPGPKIRFRLQDYNFRVGEDFTVHFDDKPAANDGATVYVDDAPLRRSLSFPAQDGKAVMHRLKGAEQTSVENVLGPAFVSLSANGDPFQRLMRDIKAKFDARDKVFAVVGDGDVFLEVNSDEFSEDRASLKCRILTVKGLNKKDELKLNGSKGFTLKGIDLSIASFTGADRQKLDSLLDADYENREDPLWEPVLTFVALSFAQTAIDVLNIREYIETRLQSYGVKSESRRLQSPSIIAKIETNKGWQNKHFILDVADGIMVARGDLGLQTEIDQVPAIQKKLIQLCNKRGKPVITATEMLKSMTWSIEPTRAEGTDVFNAIIDGSDAVMMSEETSAGKYPLHSIRKMIGIAVQAERYYEMREMDDALRRSANLLRFQEFLKDDFERISENTKRFEHIVSTLETGITQLTDEQFTEAETGRLEWRVKLYREKRKKSLKQPTTNLITQATCTMSEGEDIKCIIAASTSGRTVRMISRLRPSMIIIGAAHDILNTRKLSVSYGVLPICIGEADQREKTEGIFVRCQNKRSEDEYLEQLLTRGDMVIFTAGTRLGRPGTTNLIQMRKIDEDEEN